MTDLQLLLPKLSLADPMESEEGAIDPLGLELLAEDMAQRLIPGVRERMQHPRYLTIMAVGVAVCESFDDDVVSADRSSPPWQVFEWYVVESFVRQGLTGFALPGRLKARDAIQRQIGLARDRYLKIPSVFSFHGVYRYLAKSLGVIAEDSMLGIAGDDLIQAWVEDHQLHGLP